MAASSLTCDVYTATFTALLAKHANADEHRARRRFFHGLGEEIRNAPLRSPARQVPAARGVPARAGRAYLNGRTEYLTVGCELMLGALIRQVLAERIDGRHP